jgi:hypothetical protein
MRRRQYRAPRRLVNAAKVFLGGAFVVERNGYAVRSSGMA